MNILEIEIDKIKPYEKNPRKNDAAVNGVAESIKQFGFQQPIVIDKNDVIVVGHTRYRAAKKLGLKTVPCVRADGLTKAQVKAYRIADNKLNELSTWDFDVLGEELESFDFDFTPFEFDLPTFNFENDDESEEEKSDLKPSRLTEEKKTASYDDLKESGNYKYGVYVELETEAQQYALYMRLTDEGYSVRTTTV